MSIRYVSVGPKKVVVFPGEPRASAQSSITLTNVSDVDVAFLVKSSHPQFYQVYPPIGYVPSRETVVVGLMTKSSLALPFSSSPPHRLQISVLPIPEGSDYDDPTLTKLFQSPVNRIQKKKLDLQFAQRLSSLSPSSSVFSPSNLPPSLTLDSSSDQSTSTNHPHPTEASPNPRPKLSQDQNNTNKNNDDNNINNNNNSESNPIHSISDIDQQLTSEIARLRLMVAQQADQINLLQSSQQHLQQRRKPFPHLSTPEALDHARKDRERAFIPSLKVILIACALIYLAGFISCLFLSLFF